jgi:membrane protein DedA with SNARE-associated domain
VFDSITQALSGAWWAYPLILAVCLGDAVLPLLPSETIVVTAGVLSAQGVMYLSLVIVAGAVGALLGDLTSHLIGRYAGPWAREHLFRGDRSTRTLAWAEKALDERGASIIVLGRFVPGGRTAVTFMSGVVGYPLRRFVLVDGLGAVIWATYAALLGRIGGKAFEGRTGLALLVAFALALVGAGLIEGGRTLWARRRARS